MTTITRITDLDTTSLQRLRVESLQEGFRFIERLCEEWASGANRFDAPGEALFIAVHARTGESKLSNQLHLRARSAAQDGKDCC